MALIKVEHAILCAVFGFFLGIALEMAEIEIITIIMMIFTTLIVGIVAFAFMDFVERVSSPE